MFSFEFIYTSSEVDDDPPVKLRRLSRRYIFSWMKINRKIITRAGHNYFFPHTLEIHCKTSSISWTLLLTQTSTTTNCVLNDAVSAKWLGSSPKIKSSNYDMSPFFLFVFFFVQREKHWRSRTWAFSRQKWTWRYFYVRYNLHYFFFRSLIQRDLRGRRCRDFPSHVLLGSLIERRWWIIWRSL